jgi:hypothetical protein
MPKDAIIECALGRATAKDADAGVVASATVRAMSLLLGELQPLVGELATRALYARSLHLARSSFQRPASGEASTRDDLLAPLHQDLTSRAPADAKRAGNALLHSFVDLLVSLIGKSLTHRMLRTAWGVPATELPPEE